MNNCVYHHILSECIGFSTQLMVFENYFLTDDHYETQIAPNFTELPA